MAASIAVVVGGIAGGWAVYEAVRSIRAVHAERTSPDTVLSTADPVVEPAGAGQPPPLVSVVVPARDEAGRIGPCLTSLLAFEYPRVEILVVNDDSRDGTGHLAREAAAGDPRLRVLDIHRLPDGWPGKHHALWVGQAAATGEWLLFTDADTRHHPRALAAALAAARRGSADLVSLTGWQETFTWAETAAQPLIFGFLARRFPLRAVNDPADPRAAANGQFLLISRRAYDRVGGHRAIRSDLVDDVALARRVKAAGYRLQFLATTDLLRVRMYQGLDDLIEGWSKNLADLAGGALRSVGVGVRLGLRGVVPFLLLGALAVVPSFRTSAAAMAVAAFVIPAVTAFLAEWMVLVGSWRKALAQAWLAPVGAGLVALLFLRSAWQRSGRRTVTWRGRRYQPSAAESVPE